VGFWQGLIIMLVAAYIIAYLFSASTMIYLLMRRACDGQDIQEIWVPGLVPGTLVPLPKPKVVPVGEGEGGDEAAADAAPVADRVMTGAVRQATKLRFGKGEAPPEDDADEAEDDAPPKE
jgi:hypothetical protein